jgi:putative ATP-dependent endonuclease of OLD family
MHLASIEVVNFRGICRLQLDLEAGCTVLFGENAWGKTTLVEALSSTLGQRALTESDFHRLANDQHTIAKRMSITLGFAGEPPAELEPAGWRDEEGVFRLALQWAGRRPDRGRVRFSRSFLTAKGTLLALPAEQTSRLADDVVRTHPLTVFRELRLAEGLLPPGLMLPQSPRTLHEEPERAVARVFERLLTMPHQVHPGELARGLEALHQLAPRHPELFQAIRGAHSSWRRAEDMAEAPLGLSDGRSLTELADRAGAGIRQVTLLALVGSMLQVEAKAQRGRQAHPILLLEDPETHLHPIQLAIAWNLVSQLPVQKLVTTAAGSLLAGEPTKNLRRLVRRANHTAVYPDVNHRKLGVLEARRVAFHVRTHNADSLFARIWLLVEGETEAWLLPELARISGLIFPLEGIRCVSFAQAGLEPLITFADRFGIPWHLVMDGDEAGKHYLAKGRRMLKGRAEAKHLTAIPDKDLEHLLWHAGFEDVYRMAAEEPESPEVDAVIKAALRARSKPGMALEIAEAAGKRGPRSVPPLLRRMFGVLRRMAERG